MRIKDVHKTVLEILMDMPRARTDDNFLYVAVCDVLCPQVCGLPMWRVFSESKELGLVPFESVRRTRQKIQATHPELKDARTVQHRLDKEAEYLDYARS